MDYENLVRHNLVISAKDGGMPSLSSNLTLVVDVQDVNDNKPVFEHESYSGNVIESEAINTKVRFKHIFIFTYQINNEIGAQKNDYYIIVVGSRSYIRLYWNQLSHVVYKPNTTDLPFFAFRIRLEACRPV